MANNQKLELTWLGKDKEIKIEPRILIEDKEKSNCKNDPNTENMLIHGDNLYPGISIRGETRPP